MQGATIHVAKGLDARLIRPTKPATFIKNVAGRVVSAIERKGKWIRILLDDDQRIFVHLGMTGWVEHVTDSDPANPHPAAGDDHLKFERLRFVLDNDHEAVVFVDARRWGRLILTKKDTPTWTSLGTDPLDEGIDLDALVKRLAKRKKTSIKEALMDQKVLAGIGNIQAIEGLWRARIHPSSIASALPRPEVARLVRGLHWTIDRTLADLSNAKDSRFKVYGRKGEPCQRCKTTLERFELAGRTTTFCPGCQVQYTDSD